MSISSRNQSQSRPLHLESHTGTGSVHIATSIETTLQPEGNLAEDTAELLHFWGSPDANERGSDILDAGRATAPEELTTFDEDAEEQTRLSKPWYRRPSALWLILISPLYTISLAATLAPRIDIYTQLACAIHKPEYTMRQNGSDTDFISVQTAPLGSIRIDRCAADPEVQAAVATFLTVSALVMGILSCMTTGWWGSYSDRAGRKRAMAFSSLGTIILDFNFIIVALCVKLIPGGYWTLLIGIAIDGIFGGMTSWSAMINAYVADVVRPHDQARTFSLMLGLMFIGLAVGPALGSFIVRCSGSTLSVFYLAAGAHILGSLVILFILPESVTPARMALSRAKYHEYQRKNLDTSLISIIKRMFAFLKPLALFIPRNAPKDGDPKSDKQTDWNLGLVALSCGMLALIMGSFQFKFQYMTYQFGWDSETIGYWLSIVGALRAVVLVFILPALLQYLKPKRPAVQLSTESTATTNSRTLRFDFRVAMISLFIEVVSFGLMAAAPTPEMFTASTFLGSFGSGANPALQSVAMILYTSAGGIERGALFGALSVVNALSSSIIGPALFGVTYMRTVATIPNMIFILSALAVTLSFIALCLVRLPHPAQDDEETVIDEA